MPSSDIFQEIWDNWYDGSGPCADCPNRDEDHYWHPSHGGGDWNGDLAFVAQAPGDGHPSEDPKGATEDRRQRKNFGREYNRAMDFHEEVRSVEWWLFYHPETGADKRVPYYFMEMLDGDFTLEDGLYFTNAKKCADIEGENNQPARNKCEAYLRPEMEFVDPDVIVAFGNHAVSAVCDVYGWDTQRISHMLFEYYGDGPYIVPSFHWSHLHQQGARLRRIDFVRHKRDYWQQLAQVVNDAFEAST